MNKLHAEEMSLYGLMAVANLMPDAERTLFEALTGKPYVPERFVAEMYVTPGIHQEIRCTQTDGVVAVGGLLPGRPGVWRSWFCAPEAAWAEHAGELSRICVQTVKHALETDLAHRIETVTLASETRTRQWYEKIGLTYESTLRGYGSQGEDLVMYVALKNVERA